MRRSEILGLRWRNVDLENNTFDVTEQLPFKVPPKTKVIEEMAPPKSNGRKLPITELARPFFLNSLPCRKRSANRQRKTASPIMTMTCCGKTGRRAYLRCLGIFTVWKAA